MMHTMCGLWRQDLAIREALEESGELFWSLVAMLVPFGWAVLLRRLEPIRVRVGALPRF
jgi:hypothetical protein